MPTREESRQRLEDIIGDWYMIEQPEGKTDRFVMQYHLRGIYTESERTKLLKEYRSLEEKEIPSFTKEHGLVQVTDFDGLKSAAQKADDERGNVTAAIRKYLQAPEGKPAPSRLANVGNVHLDLRMTTPEGSYLIGWTNDQPKVVLQFLDGKLKFPLRDRMLDNREKDQWVAEKKLSQPLAWLTIVTPRKLTYEAEPGEVGATVETAGRFLFKAGGDLVYGVSKSDYHEYFFFFDQKKYQDLNGRWDWKLIPSRADYRKAPEDQFWMGSRPWKTQAPYITTHDREEEEAKAKREKIELLWNDATLPILEKLGYWKGSVEKMYDVEFVKVIPEKRIVIAPLLIPFKKDAQNDIITDPEKIEEVAHTYLSKHRHTYYMHEEPLSKDQVEVVESWVHRPFPSIVREGTWLGALKIHDNEIWKKIKAGELRGLSVGGRGIRRKMKR